MAFWVFIQILFLKILYRNQLKRFDGYITHFCYLFNRLVIALIATGINALNRNPPPFIKALFLDLLTVFLSPSSLKSRNFFFQNIFSVPCRLEPHLEYLKPLLTGN